jgi:redox-sensitive bicupin YhaK (pirin superfamily)
MRLLKNSPILEDEGVGARAKRFLPGRIGHLDPFVIFDEYQISQGSFFPEHPHRGFEGFQVLMEGRTLYSDNQGNEGAIDPGDVRRFVAGSGFKHSERPDYRGNVRGYLLWVKIPSKKRYTPIIFREERSSDIPAVEVDGLKIRTLIGEGSPVDTFTPVQWSLIENKGEDGHLTISKSEEENGFIYVSSGRAETGNSVIEKEEGAVIEGEGGLELRIGKGTEMVFIKGRRIGEPIVQEGHLVRW